MAKMVGDMMKGAVVDAMESVMDSGAMQVKSTITTTTKKTQIKNIRGSSS